MLKVKIRENEYVQILSQSSEITLLVHNLKKMLICHWSQNGLKFWFLLLQWPPLLSDFKWSQFYITFWSEVIQGSTYGVKCWKWEVSSQINIGLQILSDLQKNLFLLNLKNSSITNLHTNYFWKVASSMQSKTTTAQSKVSFCQSVLTLRSFISGSNPWLYPGTPQK